MRHEQPAGAQLEELLPSIRAGLADYPYDAFRGYPARPQGDGRAPWESYLLARLQAMADDPEWTFFGRSGPDGPLLLAARTARWDQELFGFALASLVAPYCPDQPDLRSRTSALLDGCLAHLRARGVKFVSARVNGDQVDVLHALEDAGFRYYETVSWPVAGTAVLAHERDPRVRLLDDCEVQHAALLAAEHGYARSHFHRDPGFARKHVDAMHAKWITTASQAGEPITVIETDGEVAGVFALRIDREMSAHLGWTYGRMRFLALDARVRGQGLGRALFQGSMHLMKAMGADQIDSGYPTKNHLSGRLHFESGFRPVHEEATFHLWL